VTDGILVATDELDDGTARNASGSAPTFTKGMGSEPSCPQGGEEAISAALG
jgi:hypothetical protein